METRTASGPRKYAAEFKQGAVRPWRESGTTCAEVARGLGVDRQGCCRWGRGPVGARALRDAELAAEVRRAFEAGSRACGSPGAFARPRRDGVATPEERVAGAMAERGWAGAPRRRAEPPGGAERGVGREDGADGPDEARFAGIAHARTRQGRPCPAVVTGMWSRMAVGRPMGERIDAAPAGDAPGMAVARRAPPEGRGHHSDHGGQCASPLPGKTMRERGTRPSTGSVAGPWDNAPAEPPVGAVRCECVHARTFDSRGRAAIETFEYMGCFHDRLRLHSALGCMSPVEFEGAHAERPLAA